MIYKLLFSLGKKTRKNNLSWKKLIEIIFYHIKQLEYWCVTVFFTWNNPNEKSYSELESENLLESLQLGLLCYVEDMSMSKSGFIGFRFCWSYRCSCFIQVFILQSQFFFISWIVCITLMLVFGIIYDDELSNRLFIYDERNVSNTLYVALYWCNY